MKHILAIVFFLSWITPLGAADMAPSKDIVPPAAAPAASILSPSPPPHRLSQVSQADCCKGHKGVCGSSPSKPTRWRMPCKARGEVESFSTSHPQHGNAPHTNGAGHDPC